MKQDSESISFVPAQFDPLSGSRNEAAAENPLRLLLCDIGVLLKELTRLPDCFRPFWTLDPFAELFPSLRNILGWLLQIFVVVVECTTLLFWVPAFLYLPGSLTIAFAVLACLVFNYVLCRPFRGPRIAHSKKALTPHDDFRNERWVFVNGIATDYHGLQMNCDRLALTFGRRIIGVHNRTIGLFGDLVECLLQRDLSYNSMDTRVAYDYMKKFALDPTVSKVIVIGHSQGGIIVSMAVDRILADLASDVVSKFEIYTFGSAASHFNDPLRSPSGGTFLSSPRRASSTRKQVLLRPHRIIRHIEHYCNEWDPVTRWGVFDNIWLPSRIANRYCGAVFVRRGATGHLLTQHYLDFMFPLDPERRHRFLDQVVEVDTHTVARREEAAAELAAIGTLTSQKDLSSSSAAGVEEVEVFARARVGETVGVVADPADPEGAAVEGRARTVRQLSRLWRYMDGRRPAEATSGL
ncbi:MAG: hypothetical protein M1819_003808 [Sarea resinae]|nr:MAG: hypothetical protein M1819_003808 [Sarea resinae]